MILLPGMTPPEPEKEYPEIDIYVKSDGSEWLARWNIKGNRFCTSDSEAGALAKAKTYIDAERERRAGNAKLDMNKGKKK